jgi:hypothetical protein
MQDKIDFAINVINKMRTAPSDELIELLKKELGEDLANFFVSYTSEVLMKSQSNNAAVLGLMSLGYLIKALEDKQNKAEKSEGYTQAPANA